MSDAPIYSVGSATEYENLIAEIKFGKKVGIIVSKEPGDLQYMISIHSLLDSKSTSFDYTKNEDKLKLPAKTVIDAIAEGIRRLEKLELPKSQ